MTMFSGANVLLFLACSFSLRSIEAGWLDSAGAPCDAAISMLANPSTFGVPQDPSKASPPAEVWVTTLDGRKVDAYIPTQQYYVNVAARPFKGFLLQGRQASYTTVSSTLTGNFLQDATWNTMGIKPQLCPTTGIRSVTQKQVPPSSVLKIKWQPEAAYKGPVQFMLTLIVDQGVHWDLIKSANAYLAPCTAESNNLPTETCEYFRSQGLCTDMVLRSSQCRQTCRC